MKLHPTRDDHQRLLGTVNQVVWSALQFLMLALLVLLLVNTAAILTLNLLYDPELLRPRYYWRGVFIRNAIFGIFFLILYFVSRSKASLDDELQDRVASIKSKILRVCGWLLMIGVTLIETMIVVTNLLFHQQITLVRTPAQSLNLIHAVIFGTIGSLLIFRTGVSKSSRRFFSVDLRSLLVSMLWHGLKKSLAFSLLYAIIFGVSTFVIYKWSVEGRDPLVHFPAFAAIYILTGLICGAHAGAIAAMRDKTDDLVKGCDSLAAPLTHAMVMNVPLDKMNSQTSVQHAIDRLKTPIESSAHGVLGRFVQKKITELAQGAWIIELVDQCSRQGNPAKARESLENTLRQKLIRIITDDMNSRLRLMQFLVYAIAVALLLSPALFLWLAR